MTEKRFEVVLNEFDEVEYIMDKVMMEDRDFAEFIDFVEDVCKENEQLKNILTDITIQLDANHSLNTYQMTIPINRVIYNELNRRLKETSFNEELRRFLE